MVASQRDAGPNQGPFRPIPNRQRFAGSLGVGAFTVVIYAVANHVAAGLEPRLLPLTRWDRAIPLLPATIWVYGSVYFTFLASCALQRDRGSFERFLRGYAVAYAISALFFVGFPTTFPRELYPVPASSSWSTMALVWFRQVDLPTNCLPSMHVASCVMSTLPFRRQRPVVFSVFVLWTAAVAVATLTVKQHYVVDVIAGLAWGAASHALAVQWGRVRETTQ